MIVVPMVISALVVGVFDLARGQGFGRVARRTLAFTVTLSAVSVLIGMALVNLLQPGDSQQLRAAMPAIQGQAGAATAPVPPPRPFSQFVVELIPRNPVESAARALDGEMLPLMVFALVFGVAVSAATSRPRDDVVLIVLLDQVFSACMRIVATVMRFAPIAVFAIVFGTAFTFGTVFIAPLLFYVVVVVAGLALQQFGVYAVLLRVVARRSPLAFYRQSREVALYAFSTASSNATLPLALEVAEKQLRLPAEVSRFALTIGSTANQNGTALFEGVTVLFLAQVYGLDLTLSQQVHVMLMSVLAGIGTAGVPGGSLPMVMVVAQSVGVPAEGLALVLGVDRFLDMCRTAVNVTGDLVIAAIVGTRGSTP
jgi:DAACS family dicarboxylate/amino acid:cation (Na+ or H+) symporter